MYGGDGLPYFCRFTNIVVDLASIYFAAQPGQERQAHRDIQDCCYAEKKICDASVSASFCQCFHVFKYRAAVLPAMIARQMAHQVFIADSSTHQIPAMENLTCTWVDVNGICKSIRRISGQSWLMHFWSTLKHPDHFNMKVLELSGEYRQLQSKGVKKISTLICMDYPCDDLNAYEKFILKLLHVRLNQEPKLVSVNSLGDYHSQAQLMAHIFNPDGSLKNDIVHGKVGTWFVGNPVWLENACMSPRYKHILTDQKAPLLLRTALQSVTPSYSCEQPNSGWKKRVAIMQRVDGNGLRRFVNFEAVLAELQVVFGIDDVSVLFFSGATPPQLQASLMCSFDVLLSPHTSQLTNLLFAPQWATLVEVQPNATHWGTASGGHEKDRTFQNYALHVGMASILVDQNTLGVVSANNSARESANNWRRADLVVDLTELRCAFRAAGITYTANESPDDPRERGSIIVAHATDASQQAYFGYEPRSRKCDWVFYLAQYPDLRAAFGNDTQKAAVHYRQAGEAEGRDCGKVDFTDGLEWMVREVHKVLRVRQVSEVQVRILHLRVPPTNPIDGKLDVLVLPPNTPAEWIQQIRGLHKMHRCNTGDFIWLSSGLAYRGPGCVDLWQENHCNLTMYLDSNPDVPRDEHKAKSHYRMSGHREGRNCNKPCLSRYSYELPPLRPPSPSKSGKTLNVLVPIRNREEHLRAFISAFSKSMQHNAINAKVFVIEQVGEGRWNKGQLFNLGFAQALSKGLADRRSNWLFTDVDVFEIQPGRLAYSDCVEPGLAKVHHLYGIGAADEVPWWSDYGNSVLGGVFCMATKLFVDVNGFSNEYWGWGFEDLDLEQRIRTASVDPSVKVGRISGGHAAKRVVQRGSLVPRLGAHGDCQNALGIADLPTPDKQRLGDESRHAYNLAKNPGVRIQKLHEDMYNSSDWRKQLQADGMRALREDAHFSVVGEGFTHLPSELWDAGSLEVHRLRVTLSSL
jgi:hypothetical protein